MNFSTTEELLTIEEVIAGLVLWQEGTCAAFYTGRLHQYYYS